MMNMDAPNPADSLPGGDAAPLPPMIPYERFAEVNRQLKALKAELEQLKSTPQTPEASEETPLVSTESVYKKLVEDPEGYLSELMGNILRQEMQLMREELELKSALKMARQKYPEFAHFEHYVLQELMALMEDDAEVDRRSWDDLMDEGFARLQQKLKSAVEQSAAQLLPASEEMAFMEGNAVRKPVVAQPTFTRDQISKMSMQDFLKFEDAINEALKNNLIL